MTEDEAQTWLRERWPNAFARLSTFVGLLRAEAERQSLIARSTFDAIWARHIVDSAQLLDLAAGKPGLWIDVGSGGGLPGIVIAILRESDILLVEPRRKRVQFLQSCIDVLGLVNAKVAAKSVEAVEKKSVIVSARAVGPADHLLRATQHIVSRETTYLLPRGHFGESDLAQLRPNWHGSFHVEQSITSPQSSILIATGVSPR